MVIGSVLVAWAVLVSPLSLAVSLALSLLDWVEPTSAVQAARTAARARARVASIDGMLSRL